MGAGRGWESSVGLAARVWGWEIEILMDSVKEKT